MNKKIKVLILFLVLVAVVFSIFNISKISLWVSEVSANTGLLLVLISLPIIIPIIYGIGKALDLKWNKRLFGWFKGKEEFKAIPQIERMQKCREFTIKFIHNMNHYDNMPETDGHKLSLVGIHPSPIRKDTTTWELYIWKWGMHTVGRSDIPGLMGNERHMIFYVMCNCSNAECFPIAVKEMDEPVKILNDVWMKGWQKIEEQEFMKAIQNEFLIGASRERGKEAVEKSDDKEKGGKE